MAQTNYPFEYQTSFGDAAEQERIAQLLLQLQGKPPGLGQMVSGHFVKTHPMQHLASVLAQWQAGQLSRNAAGMRRSAMEQAGADESRQIRSVLEAATGSPGVPQPPPDQEGPWMPPVSADPRRAVQLASGSKFPNVQKMGDDLRALLTAQLNIGAPAATPESRIQASQTGDPRAFVPEPAERYGPLSNVAPPGSPPLMGQASQKTGKLNFAPQPQVGANVTVNASRADQGLVGEHYKFLTDPKMRQPAEQAAGGLQAGGQLLGILGTGVINMGTGAGTITEIQKLSKFMGKPVPPEATGTQVYQGLIMPYLGQLVQMFGAGTGISDADREAAKAGLADASKDPNAAKALLMFMMRKQWDVLDRYNTMARAGTQLANSAQMNPEIFNAIGIPFQFRAPPGIEGHPSTWPDAYSVLQEQQQQQSQPIPRRRWEMPGR